MKPQPILVLGRGAATATPGVDNTQELIEAITLGSAGAITFSGLDLTPYQAIFMLVQAREAVAATSGNITLTVNGDTTNANYWQAGFVVGSAAISPVNAGDRRIGACAATNSPANSFSTHRIELPFPNAGRLKTFLSRGGVYHTGTTGGFVDNFQLTWLNTAAITSLSISGNGNNLATGSSAVLYGLK
jgi:hypothetical protein